MHWADVRARLGEWRDTAGVNRSIGWVRITHANTSNIVQTFSKWRLKNHSIMTKVQDRPIRLFFSHRVSDIGRQAVVWQVCQHLLLYRQCSLVLCICIFCMYICIYLLFVFVLLPCWRIKMNIYFLVEVRTGMGIPVGMRINSHQWEW